ncbi:hypothetical protein OIF85_10345, partial [Neisseria meningitidis]|nr:hypothetical protein [Neisseria meningitidis]MCV6692359.1 hypothetical protein [Neisseria meningitidis]MCV6694448.1 hypothetical protein [Neisseria meningitidis]MCV6698627.1 hypothetical protein [Neisseria meningitidis]MCV6700664.1 hypothetical protein [Neisseria meningitidis]
MEWVSLFSDPQKDDDSLITLKDEKITVKNYIVPWWKKGENFRKLELGGFAFEVQLSLTEKGQYAVAYGLSCKKDCHELHATDPGRTIP